MLTHLYIRPYVKRVSGKHITANEMLVLGLLNTIKISSSSMIEYELNISVSTVKRALKTLRARNLIDGFKPIRNPDYYRLSTAKLKVPSKYLKLLRSGSITPSEALIYSQIDYINNRKEKVYLSRIAKYLGLNYKSIQRAVAKSNALNIAA